MHTIPHPRCPTCPHTLPCIERAFEHIERPNAHPRLRLGRFAGALAPQRTVVHHIARHCNLRPSEDASFFSHQGRERLRQRHPLHTTITPNEQLDEESLVDQPPHRRRRHHVLLPATARHHQRPLQLPIKIGQRRLGGGQLLLRCRLLPGQPIHLALQQVHRHRPGVVGAEQLLSLSVNLLRAPSRPDSRLLGVGQLFVDGADCGGGNVRAKADWTSLQEAADLLTELKDREFFTSRMREIELSRVM